jgi:uncharacterized membrane protein YczE
MKDIVFTPKQQKNELIWIAACLCAAVLINVLAIILYKTEWSEFYTQLLWVLLIACVLYAISVGFRVILYFVKRFFNHNNQKG